MKTNPAFSDCARRLIAAWAARLLPLLPLLLPEAVLQAQQSWGPFYYTVNLGTVTIVGYGPGFPVGALTIPDTINGMPVTSLGYAAIRHASGLTSITIPSSVTNIADIALDWNFNLASIYFEGDAPTLGSDVFDFDPATVYYPAWAQGYGSNFGGLPAVVNPASEFDYTTNDGRVTIEDYIGPPGPVTVPSLIYGLPVTAIDSYAFAGCVVLLVTFPDSVTSIGDSAFRGCLGLSSVTIGNGVASIGDHAFADCLSLTNVTIPNSVTSIGTGAFAGCTTLQAINVNGYNPTYSSLDGVLFNADQTRLIQCPETRRDHPYTIPSTVTSIGDYAFSGCHRLLSVVIPNRVTNIEDYAFQDCLSLVSLTLPGSVSAIGDDTFSQCVNLAAVYFQGNAPAPGANVFLGTTSATAFYFGGTTGWGPTFAGIPTALWPLPNPIILGGGGFGVGTNGFGFVISWATNVAVVVEACSHLVNPDWSPVGTNTLANGWSYFSDPQWNNYPSRFYRLSPP